MKYETEERDYSIREAMLSDMAECAKVFKISKEISLPFVPQLHTPEEDVVFFSNHVFEKDLVYIAITNDTKKVCGFIAFNDYFVDHLYLLPDAQGVGLGSRLLNVAKNHSPYLKIWAFQKNEVARKFYAKQGFVEIEETDGIDNEEKLPDVLFEWRSSLGSGSEVN
jgi:putative acetyltransferase